jgi:hypothetical protein
MDFHPVFSPFRIPGPPTANGRLPELWDLVPPSTTLFDYLYPTGSVDIYLSCPPPSPAGSPPVSPTIARWVDSAASSGAVQAAESHKWPAATDNSWPEEYVWVAHPTLPALIKSVAVQTEPIVATSYVTIMCPLAPRPRPSSPSSPCSGPPSPSSQPVYSSRQERDRARLARKEERRRQANQQTPGTYVWCPDCCLQVRALGHETRCGDRS